jgi:hypothetical protein
MKKKYLALLFVLTALPFLVYSFRTDLIGADGYLYLETVCHNANFSGQKNIILQDGVQNLLFSFIPCNLNIIKSILFALCFGSVFIIAKMGELFDKENGWIAGLAAIVFTNLFISGFFEFENDQFAIPILFAGAYFLLKGKLQQVLQPKIIGVALICIAGLIWHGAIFYLLAFGISFFPAMLLFGSIGLLVNPLSLVVLLPNITIMENAWISGIAAQKFLLAGFAGLQKNLLPETIVLTIISFLNLKFAILLLPILAIGTMLFLNKLMQKRNALAPGFLSGIGIATYGFIFASIFLAVPTSADWKAINSALSYSNKIQNDWDYGYWIAYAGGQPSAWGGGTTNNFTKQGIILSQFEQIGCKELESFKSQQGSFLEPAKIIKVWEC